MSTRIYWHRVMLIYLQINAVCSEVPVQFTRRGNNVTLVCPYRGSTNWNIVLERNILISQGTDINPNLPNKDRLSVVETPEGNMNLHITNVTDIDTGQYDCAVGSQSTKIRLKFYVNPNFPSILNSVQNGSRMLGIEGQVLTMTCDSRGGNPPAEVTWLRGQTTLQTGQNSTSYTWIPVRADDKTDYICQSNSTALVSPLTTTVQLYLSLKPIQPTLTYPEVKENTEMTVTCLSTGSRPAALLSLIFRGTQQSPVSLQQNTSDTQTDTLTVSSKYRLQVNRSDNGQPLTCTARNSASSYGISSTQNVVVRFGPDSVSISGSTTLNERTLLSVRCTASSSNPQSTIVWFKNGNQFTPNTQILTSDGDNNGRMTYQDFSATVVKKDNKANITCNASTSAGSAENYVILDVRFRPTVHIQPSRWKAIVDDLNVQFMCFVNETNPNVQSYIWIKGTQILTGRNSQNYTIGNVSRSDKGTYKCQAVNVVGTSEPASAVLEVLYPAFVSRVTVNDSNTYEGSTVYMSCYVDSNPVAKVVWMNLNTQSILKTDVNVVQSEMMIRSTSCRDTGYYSCSAYNGIGLSSNKSLRLNILCSPFIINRQGKTERLSVKLETSIELSLSIVSNPAPTIKWFYQKSSQDDIQPELFSKIDTQHEGVLFITKLSKDIKTKDDIGMYSISVLNSHGSATYTFILYEQTTGGSGAVDRHDVNGGSIALFSTGAALFIVGICFFTATVVITRRKRHKRNTNTDKSESTGQFYHGLNPTEINKNESAYEELKV